MRAIRWGLVGATVIGREWMVDAIRQAGGEVASIMSRDAPRGRSYAAEFGIPHSTTELDDLFAKVDAVYIATTNERHRAECVAAAAAGKHVLCEKPLATSLNDARAMVAACRKAGVVMATNHHLRNAATHRASREAIAAGRIGTPLAARVLHGGALPEHLHGWRLKDPKAGAGVILDLTVHDSDLLRFILGDEPETIVTLTQNGGLAAPGIEDAAAHVLKFRSGLIAQIYETFTNRYVRTSVEVHGSEGSLIAMDCMAQAPGGTVVLRSAKGEELLPLRQENYYARGVRLFHDAMAGKGAPAATGEDGVISLAVALAALGSANSGRAEKIEPGL